MFKKTVSIIAALAATVTMATSAFAAFDNFHLIRVVSDKTSGSTLEIATDLGDVRTLTGEINTTVGGGGDAFTHFIGASPLSNLSVTYYAVNRTSLLNGSMYIGANTAAAPATAGVAQIQNKLSNTSTTNSANKYYGTLALASGSTATVIANNLNANSLSGTFGSTNIGTYGGYANSFATNTNLTLTNLATTPVAMTVWQFGSEAGINMASPLTGLSALKLTTNADGSTTINPLTAQTINAINFAPASLLVGGVDGTVSTTATSGLPVTFSSATPSVCSVNGATVHPLAAGTCTVAADQDGNTVYAAAPQVTQNIVVGKGTQTIAFATPPKIVTGGTNTLSATATSGLPVTLTSKTLTVCTVNGATVTGLTAGVCTVAATQTGNSNYNAAAAVSKSFTVVSLASSASTSFDNFHLIRVISDKTSGSTLEIVTDLGDVRTLAGLTNTSVGGGNDAFTKFIGASALNKLSVVYYAVNRTSLLNGTLYIGANNAAAPTTPGVAQIQNKLSNTSTTNSANKYYDTLPLATGSAVTVIANNLNANSLSGTFGSTNIGTFGGYANNFATNTNLSLANLATTPVLTYVWQFGNEAGTNMAAPLTGVKLFELATNADGSTTINPADATKPVVSAFSVPAAVNSLTVPVTNFTANDHVGVTGYLITKTATVPLATATTWSATAPATFTAAAGLNTLYAWVKDAAGNVSSPATATVLVDTTKPLVTAFTATPAVSSLTVPVTSFTATDNIGVAGYMIKSVATTVPPAIVDAPLATDAGWSATAPTSHTPSITGLVTLYAWVKDAVGNVSAAKTAKVNIDQTVPVITAFTLNSYSLKQAPVKITVTDNTKVTGYLFTESAAVPSLSNPNWSALKPLSYTFATAGFKTLYAWVRDAAGNISASMSATTTADDELPQVGAFTVPAYSKGIIPITAFTATDDNLVASYMITLTPDAPLATTKGWVAKAPTTFSVKDTTVIPNIVVTPAGLNTLYAWVKDAAGNVSSTAVTAQVFVDLTAPVVESFSVVPTGINSLTVPVNTFTGSDNIGVTGYLITTTPAVPLATLATWSATAPTTFVTTAGQKTLYAWVKDAAGNVSSPVTDTVLIDTVKPLVTAFTVTTPVNSLTVPVTTFTVTEVSSSISGYMITETATTPLTTDAGWSETAPASYTFTTAGSKSLYAWAKDAVGNVSAGKLAKTVITLP